MPSKNADLNKKVSDKSKVALLIVDMISDFEFEDGEKLFKYALPAARRMVKLKKEAKREKIPVIYINDNFGKWQEDFEKMTENCLKDSVRGSAIVRLLKPEPDDYYVLKPKNSAFYSTPLDLILNQLGAEILIMVGVSTDICILFTANDAYMRDYKLIVPKDCVASIQPKLKKSALEYIERVLKADIRSSDTIDFQALLKS